MNCAGDVVGWWKCKGRAAGWEPPLKTWGIPREFCATWFLPYESIVTLVVFVRHFITTFLSIDFYLTVG